MKFLVLSNANTVLHICLYGVRDDIQQKNTLPYDSIRSLTSGYWENTKYYTNCKKNLGLRIRGEKVFLQVSYESYSLLLTPT